MVVVVVVVVVVKTGQNCVPELCVALVTNKGFSLSIYLAVVNGLHSRPRWFD